MADRAILVDNNKHEWMRVTQYARALYNDFDIKVSHSLVSLAKSSGKIHADLCQRKNTKPCINYTASVADFLQQHPMIAPKNLTFALKEWQKLLHPDAKANMKLVGKDEEVTARRKSLKRLSKQKKIDIDDDTDPNDESELSAAVEKARHEKIKREKAEFEFEIFKGNYISIDDVTSVLQTIAIEVRQSVKALIPRCAAIVSAEDNVHTNKATLEKETDVALNHLERLPQIIDGSFAESEAKKAEADQ